MRSFLVAAVVAAGCGFSVAPSDDDTPPVPDAGPCMAKSDSCASDTLLRSCAGAGASVVERACPWGCVSSATAHCGVLTPSGTIVTTTDLAMTDVQPIVLSAITTIDANTGEITGVRAMGEGVKSGIGYELRSGLAIFRFQSLAISAAVNLRGDHPIAIVADGAITINAVIDGRGDPVCSDLGRTAGPGGFDGGAKEQTAPGSGGGTATTVDQNGGGGGGHGDVGGTGSIGGVLTAGGPAFGTDAITPLVGGGGGGGGGGGANAGLGGGGGAALHMVSNTSITIGVSGGVNAGGCGGDEGTGGNDAGGGGGAGGAILLEAPAITIAGALAVNGGGGGTHNDPGMHATLDRSPAAGGTPSVLAEGTGGPGAAGATLAGGAAAVGTFGGGGGAIGRIRFHTRTGVTDVQPGAVLSPALTDNPTRCTESTANVQ